MYGDGAEVHAPSSRVTLPDAQETHRVVCVPREGGFENLLDPGAAVPARMLELDRFVALDGTWFSEAPPFDHVLAFVGEEPIVVAVEVVRFVLEAVE